MKFIITTRLESDYPEDLHITDSKYVRLFSFSQNETEEFFSKYLLNTDYTDIIRILGNDVLSTPLFCWIAAFAFKENLQLLLDSENNGDNKYNSEITKTDLYLHFIHSLIKGRRHNIDEGRKTIEKYNFEKSALRRIAALKVLKSNLTKDDITNDGKFSLSVHREEIEKILSAYFFEEFYSE
jgi:hypothetical protein